MKRKMYVLIFLFLTSIASAVTANTSIIQVFIDNFGNAMYQSMVKKTGNENLSYDVVGETVQCFVDKVNDKEGSFTAISNGGNISLLQTIMVSTASECATRAKIKHGLDF